MRGAAWLLVLLSTVLAAAAVLAPAASAPVMAAAERMPAAATSATDTPALALARVADLPASTEVPTARPTATATPAPPTAAAASNAPAISEAPVATTVVPAVASTVSPDPFPVTNTVPLPKCEYQDLPTLLRPNRHFDLVIVDKAYSVGKDYVPPDLVRVRSAGFPSKYEVRELVIDDLGAMRDAAIRAGASLAVVSAYRGYREQIWSFNHWLYVLGPAAFMSSARPGHSEHQLGLAIDFRAAGGSMPWNYRDWSRETLAGAWMAQNAWKFGFVMSYPRGKAAQTCYEFEPWHYRYVGREVAAAIHDSGSTPRAWLWRHQPQQPLPPTPVPSSRVGPMF